MDLDGSVEVADAVLLTKSLCGRETLNEQQGRAGDLNGDRKLNAVDLTLLKRLLFA